MTALERLFEGKPGGSYNLGNGTGYSVREVIDTARSVTGREIPERIVPRRPGDPSRLIGSSDLARHELGWRPDFPDLSSIIETAWRWHVAHPRGYAA